MSLSRLSSFILALAVAFFCLSGCGKSETATPESVACELVSAAYTGDTAKVFSMLKLNKAVPNDAPDREKLQEFMGKLGSAFEELKHDTIKKGGIASVKAVKTEYTDDRQDAAVTVEVSYKKAGTKPDTQQVKLHYTGSIWEAVLL